MKNLLVTTFAAGVMATAALGLATQATAAVPPGPSNVTSTVNALEAQGYNVILNRVGTAPMSECKVGSVRPGHEVTRTDSGFPGDTLTTAVISKTVHVDVEC